MSHAFVWGPAKSHPQETPGILIKGTCSIVTFRDVTPRSMSGQILGPGRDVAVEDPAGWAGDGDTDKWVKHREESGDSFPRDNSTVDLPVRNAKLLDAERGARYMTANTYLGIIRVSALKMLTSNLPLQTGEWTSHAMISRHIPHALLESTETRNMVTPTNHIRNPTWDSLILRKGNLVADTIFRTITPTSVKSS